MMCVCVLALVIWHENFKKYHYDVCVCILALVIRHANCKKYHYDVCVYPSLSYLAWKLQEISLWRVCVSYLRSVRLYHIFSILSHKRHDIGGGDWHKTCILILYTISARNISRTIWRHCSTSRKVEGWIPDGVLAIFYWLNPFGRTMARGRLTL
jgi:hypothetical protein